MNPAAAILCLSLVYGTCKGRRYEEDITIIGAGIGGTYTGWRLRNRGLRIGIYEYSNRVGGRMYTRRFPDAPDLPVDFGAMRLLPEKHLRMMKAGKELGLHFIPFNEGLGKIPNRTILFYRDTHMTTFELGGPRTPYNLRPEELRNPRDLAQYLSETFSNYNGTDPKTELFTATTRDGVPLYHQSYKEVIQKTGISKEAYNYIIDSSTFHDDLLDAQSILRFPKPRTNTTRHIISTRSPVLTVSEGMDSFPKGFMKQFISSDPLRHRYFRNRQLVKISRSKRGKLKLKFKRTRTINGKTIRTKRSFKVYTRNVVLAVPKVPLQLIRMPESSNDRFQAALNSVTDVKASKIFLVYDYAWWLQGPINFTYTHSDLPYRQSFHWGISRTGKAVLLISYADFEDPSFWSQLQQRGNVISKRNDDTRVTDQVVKHVHYQLSKVYNINFTFIPKPVDGMMFVWEKYPFNGAWVIWKPGSRWYDIKDYLTKPFLGSNIYIVHGHWGAEYRAWGEASLKAADDVLSHFKLLPYYTL